MACVQHTSTRASSPVVFPGYSGSLQKSLQSRVSRREPETVDRLAHAWVNDGTDLKIWQLTEMVTERNGPEILVKAEGKQT